MSAKPRKWKMWAVTEGRRLAVVDFRAPIMWSRRVAKEWAEEENFDDAVIRVEVREIRQRKGKR